MNTQSTNRESIYRLISLALILIGILFLMVIAANARTITVTSTGDTIAVDGVVTLREAITAANTNAASGDAPAGDPGQDVIKFNIPGSGVQTISPSSALPDITESITIDGYTQPGASANTLAVGSDAVLLIELNGTNVVGFFPALTVTAGNSTIKGLVINHFGAFGIYLQIGGSNTIAGNFIGTNASGKKAAAQFPTPNQSTGLYIKSANNLIGGLTPADRNVLSGNTTPSGGQGLYLDTASANSNTVIGNYIGTSADGAAGIGNGNNGISINGSSSNIIGGTTPAERNVISGNGSNAVSIGGNASNNQITGNFIGTKADGVSALSNSVAFDIENGPTNNKIGGTAAGTGNVIAFNSSLGIFIGAQSTGIAVEGNSIYANGSGLGIDLLSGGSLGVTPNDDNTGDADTGANNLQNYPVLTSIVASGGNTTIQGTLDSAPSTQFRVELFSNTSCNGSGFGEGQKFLGFAAVTTDASGKANFSAVVPTASVTGGFFTATATDPGGNTSEFSVCTSGVVNNPGTLQLSTNSLTQLENSGSFTINVNRTNGSTGTVTVHYATADGTAHAPADYTSTSGTLTFNDGETIKPITVPIIDDNTPEGFENFTLTLSSPTGGAVLGGTTLANLSIQDNEAPTISITDVSQAEGNSGTTAFTFTVTTSNAISNDIDFHYATANGTATSGSDYQAANGTAVITAGQFSKTITINVTGDAISEPDETFFVNLSSPGGATIAKGQGIGTILNDDGPGAPTVQFNAATYTAQEDLSALTVTVTRSGDTSGPASVDYSTTDGTATQKGDFEYAAGRLTFAPGDTSKTFQVLINEDMYLEGSETFGLALTNATGAGLGGQSTATVTILDDAPESLTNPIDDPQSFVYMQYHDFLNREPDPSGLAFWTNQIASCNGNQACIDTKRVNVSAAFFLSIEFQQTGYLVERIYKTSYGNLPGAPVPVLLNEFVPDTRAIGQGVIVGQAGWETILENNKQAFVTEFVQRSRFTLAYPTSMTPAQFVDALFANAGVIPAPAERLAAINEFAGGVTTADNAARGRAVRDVAENAALTQQESNRAFVMMEYFGYLRRDPNAAPEPGLNYGGYNFWLSKLNQFNGDYASADMVKAFLSATEYRQRFGQ